MGANQSRPTRRATGSRHKTYPSAHGRTYSEPAMPRGNYGWPHAPELPQAQMQAMYQNGMGMPMYNGGYAAPPPPQFGMYQPQPSQMSGYAPVHYPQPPQSQPPQQQQYYNQQHSQPQQYYEQPTQSQSQQYYAAPPPPPIVSQPQSQPPHQPVIPPPPQMSQVSNQAPIFAPFQQPASTFQQPTSEPVQAPAPPPPIVSQPRQPSPPAPPPPPAQPAPPPPSISAPPFLGNPIHRPPLYDIPPALRYDEPHSGHTPLRNPLPEPPRDVFDDPRFAALRDHQWEREAADIGISPEALYTVKTIPESTSSASGHTRAASTSTASDMHRKKSSGGGFFSTLARVGTKKKKDKGKERVNSQAPAPSPTNSDNPAIPVKWTFRTGVQPSPSDPIPVINPSLQPPAPPPAAVPRSNYSDRHHDSPRSTSSHSPTPPGSPPQGPGPEPTPFPGGYSGPLNSAPFSPNDINPETGLPKGFIPSGPPSAGPPPPAPLAAPMMNAHQSERTGSSNDWYRPTSPQVRSPQMRSPRLSSPLLTASPMPLPIPAPFEHGGRGGPPSMPFSSQVFPHMMRLAFASDHPIMYSDQVWPTAAHLLESMKFTPTESGPELPPEDRAQLPELREAVRRKTLDDMQDFVAGASDWVRSDWAEVAPHKADEVLWYKLNQYRELRGLLHGTGDHELLYVEPNDLFWGAADAGGRNELGKALMRARDTFREGSEVGRR